MHADTIPTSRRPADRHHAPNRTRPPAHASRTAWTHPRCPHRHGHPARRRRDPPRRGDPHPGRVVLPGPHQLGRRTHRPAPTPTLADRWSSSPSTPPPGSACCSPSTAPGAANPPASSASWSGASRSAPRSRTSATAPNPAPPPTRSGSSRHVPRRPRPARSGPRPGPPLVPTRHRPPQPGHARLRLATLDPRTRRPPRHLRRLPHRPAAGHRHRQRCDHRLPPTLPRRITTRRRSTAPPARRQAHPNDAVPDVPDDLRQRIPNDPAAYQRWLDVWADLRQHEHPTSTPSPNGTSSADARSNGSAAPDNSASSTHRHRQQRPLPRPARDGAEHSRP